MIRTILAVALLMPSAAYCHDRWANGDPVPAWVKDTCCGPADANHLRPEQMHIHGDEVTFDGYPNAIKIARLTPSPDGEIWVFWKRYDDGTFSPIFCAFAPVGSS